MFKNLKLIFSPKNKDIRKRISFTLIGLLIFAFGTTIPVPGTEGAISSLGLWELYNAIGGGALKNFSIFALGVMPYISASIITGILQMDIVPYFTELKESGEQGRQKINQINRYLGIAIAFVQGFAMAFTFIKGASTIQYFEIAIILTGGTALLLWLGDQITQKGIGNGISLIIMAGIISTVPKMFIDTFSTLVTSRTGSLFIGIVGFSLFVLLYLLIVVGVVFEECSERRIPIQYSNRTTASYGQKQNYIPFKINSAGVMPVIFASVLLSIPTFIAGILGSDSGFSLFVSKYIDAPNLPLYSFGYGLSYSQFEYSKVSLSSKKMSMDTVIEASVIVENKSEYEGVETVQMYINDVVSSVSRSVKELKGIKKITLKPYEKKKVDFIITNEMLKFYRCDMKYDSEAGKFIVYIGHDSLTNNEECFELIK